MLLIFLLFVLTNGQCPGPAAPSCFVTGLGLYAMNLTGQPMSGTTDPGMLGSIAIDGSPTGCQNVNIGEIVLPNVFDGLGESFSVEAWIMHPNPADGTYKPFLARHPGTNLGNEASEFTFQIQRDGNINFFTGCGNYWQYGFEVGLTAPQQPLWNGYVLQPNTWTHVAATVKWETNPIGPDFGLVTLYVDGNLVDQKPWGSNDYVGACTGRKRSRAPGQPVRIGYYDNSDNGVQTYGGFIDEIRIWNRTLTQQDIQNHMHGLFFNKTDMVAYFGFSEGGEGLFPTQAVRNLRHSFNQGLSQFPCCSGFYDQSTQLFSFLPWSKSGLKIHNAPIITTTKSGSASGQLFGIDLTTSLNDPVLTYDYWITGMMFTTDATAWYSNNGVRTPILPGLLPIRLPSLQQIEYQPGARAGIDVILYQGRSKLTGAWEPGFSAGFNSTTDCCHGPTKMTFQVICPLGQIPDRCGVCNGDNTTFCPCFCDAMGNIQTECGTCGFVGSYDCRGCDCIPFSGTTLDCCGVCGGNGTSCTCPPPPPNGTCVEYKGFTTQQMDLILLQSSLNAIDAQLALVQAQIAAIDAKLPNPATVESNLALAAEILQMNQFCPSSSALSQELALLLQQLQAYAGGACGPVPLYPCTPELLYQI